MKTKILFVVVLILTIISCDPTIDISYKTKDFYPEIVSPTVPVKDPMETLFKAKLQYTGYVMPEISGYKNDSVSPDSVVKKPVYKYQDDENPANFEYGVFISKNGNFGLNDADVIHVSFKGTDKFKVTSITDSIQVYNAADSTINIVVASQSIAKRLLEEWTEYSYMIYAKNKRGKGYSTRGGFITGGTLGFGITTIPADSVSNLTYASAQIKGYVVSSGGRAITTMGVVYSTDKSVIDALGVGSAPGTSSPFKYSTSPTKLTGETGYFDVAITDLSENTKYYFKTYALNGYRDNSRNTVKYSDKTGTIETSAFDGFPIVTYGVTSNVLTAMAATKTFNAQISFKVASRRDQVTEYGYYIRRDGVFNKVVGVLNSTYKLNAATNEFVILFNNLPQSVETVLRPYVIIDGKENVVERTPVVRFMSGVYGRIQMDPNNPGVYLNNDQNVYYELPGIPYNGFVYRFLDRNLGAKKALGELSDGFDYPKTGTPVQDNAGWLFQWGRSADGHQIWDAVNTTNQSALFGYPAAGLNSWDEAWNYKTITKITDPVTSETRDSISYKFRGAFCTNGSTFSWLSGNVNSFTNAKTLWNTSKSGGKNNPCPPGYRVPSSAELSILVTLSNSTWINFKNLTLADGTTIPLMFCGSANITRNASGSGYSLRPSAGYSSQTAFFWSCTPTQALNKIMGFGLSLTRSTDKGTVALGTNYSAAGCYVRCISTDILPRP